LLILKLWATGASMVAGQSTRGPGASDAAAQTESIPEKVELASPPAGEDGAVVQAAPASPSSSLAANEDTEPASPRGFDDTGPPLLASVRRLRPPRFRPPRRDSRVSSPPLALRI